MKRLIGYTAALCLLAFTVGCGGVTSTGTLAYISNSTGTGFTVYTVNTDGTLTTSSISPQSAPTPAGDGPKVMQIAANGKWAYYLDNAGNTIYGYYRDGNGTLTAQIGTWSVSGGTSGYGASALVIHPNNMFLYASLPNYLGGAIAIYSIDQSTGILTQVGSNIQLDYPISQLVMTTSGGAIFGLSPASNFKTSGGQTITGKQAVLFWTVNSSSGLLTGPIATPVGVSPNYMVLSANGSYMYVLDNTATTLINATTIVNGQSVSCATLSSTSAAYTGCYSPNIYGYNVSTSSTTPLSPMAGTSVGGGNVFNENADLITGIFPSNPVAGVTTNDTHFLFVANQGSHNVSVFKLNATSGQPTEVLGSLSTVNGISVSSASPFDCGSGCSTPSFAAVAKANNALYLLDINAGRIFQFAVNENTGQIRALSPASVGAETATSHPAWITIR
ncbi:MAG: beta-propeller fold lactonase family protein [Candidatus Korobacteraceae bacterium]|jgi:6-phosphogluconolactonase (cycloisomerase 2 family)